MMAVHDHPRPHRPRQFIHHATPGRMATGRFMCDQNVGLLGCERLDVLRPDRGRGQRMGQRRALLRSVRRPKRGKIIGKLAAVMQARTGRGRPDTRPERSAQAGDANAADFHDPGMKRA